MNKQQHNFSFLQILMELGLDFWKEGKREEIGVRREGRRRKIKAQALTSNDFYIGLGSLGIGAFFQERFPLITGLSDPGIQGNGAKQLQIQVLGELLGTSSCWWEDQGFSLFAEEEKEKADQISEYEGSKKRVCAKAGQRERDTWQLGQMKPDMFSTSPRMGIPTFWQKLISFLTSARATS